MQRQVNRSVVAVWGVRVLLHHFLYTVRLHQQAWNILRPVQDAHNLKRLCRRVVDDEVGIHGPEEHGLIGEILASMTKSRMLS